MIQKYFAGVLLVLLCMVSVTDVHAACTTLTKGLLVGSKGNEVLLLQKYLVSEKYLATTPNGYFGQATKKAVIAFQKSNGLKPVGSVGALTRAKISEVSCGGVGQVESSVQSTAPAVGGSATGASSVASAGSQCINFNLAPKMGQKDASVNNLQKFLVDKGYLKTAPSGEFDFPTSFALIAYQDDNKLNSSNVKDNLRKLTCGASDGVNANGTRIDVTSTCSADFSTSSVSAFLVKNNLANDIHEGEDVPGLFAFQREMKKSVSNTTIQQTGKLDKDTRATICMLSKMGAK
jgi:N-acetylmuramoyl-L-alanine amidase